MSQHEITRYCSSQYHTHTHTHTHRCADLRFFTRRFSLGRSRKFSKNCSRSLISDVSMLKIQPKYIMVSRIENSPYNAVSCNSNEMLRVVCKVALVTLTAETSNSKQGRVWQVCNFTECDAVYSGRLQCYISEIHYHNIHLYENLKANVLKHQKYKRELHICQQSVQVHKRVTKLLLLRIPVC